MVGWSVQVLDKGIACWVLLDIQVIVIGVRLHVYDGGGRISRKDN